MRIGLDKVASIRCAANDRITPAFGIKGQLGRRKQIPHDTRAIEHNVGAVACLGSKLQIGLCKLENFLADDQSLTQNLINV